MDMDVFAALAEPTRREILVILAEKGELPVGEIKKHFRVSAPAVSQHLGVLKDSGLVTFRKQAQSRIYQINQKGMGQAQTWLDHIGRVLEGQMDRLESFLQPQTKQPKRGKQNGIRKRKPK